MSTIEIRGVSKDFGRTNALKNVSLTLSPEKIYGLLGRNGAGKTTLINIITNRLFATSGDVLIDGESVTENDRAQAKISCMSEKNGLLREIRVRDGFHWTREFHAGFDMDYALGLAERFDLDTGKKVKALSTGYRSIYKLISTLASGAEVLIFDEPVLGLDANHRDIFYRELIAHYSGHPKTVVISTHLIDEVADILEEAIILKSGEVMLAQPVESMLQLAYSVSGDSAGVDRYSQGKNVIREETIGRFKSATIFQERKNADKDLVRKLGLEITPAKLQELFICLTNS